MSEERTELYEILERFQSTLDGNDLSDLSRMCREYAVNVHESRLASLRARPQEPDELQKLVDEQAEDEGLWGIAANIVEAYLQQELRRLHAAREESK